jgi:hypothetical protein
MRTEIEMRELRKQIILHYAEKYQSSPVPLSRHQVKRLVKADCKCEMCGKSIFEMDDFINIMKNEIICEDCFHEQYEATCPICEEYFLKALKAKDEKIVVTKESFAELGLDKPGFYEVKSYPYFRACIVSGVEQLYNDSLKLIHECDINSMLTNIRGVKHEIISGECCHDCVNKYTGKTSIRNNYVNKTYGKKMIEIERQVIKKGF